MSAYVCNDLTTASVALTCLEISGHHPSRDLLQKLGDLLRAENTRSVNYRYSEAGEPDPFVLPSDEALAKLAALPELRKLGNVRCYGYQTCETPDWEETPAGRMALTAQRMLQARTGSERGEGWGVIESELAVLAVNS